MRWRSWGQFLPRRKQRGQEGTRAFGAVRDKRTPITADDLALG
jgi:hypothetical protein